MSEQALHPTPRGRDVLLEQVRIVALRLRPLALVLATVLGIVTILIAIDIARGSAETWFDAGDWAPLLFVSFLLPFAVWRKEKRFGPAFLWTLPVDRRRLALARVFGGWVWLVGALAILIVWQRVLALLSGVAGARTIPLIAFTGATSAYLLGSAVVLGLRHPLRWFLGGAGVVWLVGLLRVVTRHAYGEDASDHASTIEIAMNHVDVIWRSLPQSSRWVIATVISIAAGVAVLWAALARHRERRRH